MTSRNSAVQGYSDLGALVGRLLIGAIFVSAGYGKALAATATIAYFGKLGLPMPPAAYALTVVVELGVGLMFVLGLFGRTTALILAVWCIATALAAHTNFADTNMKIHFMKNIAMCGGLIYAALWGSGAFSLDGLLAGRRSQPAAPLTT